MNKFERFFTIQKIDADEQMVFGYASTADLDSDGEVIKIEALEKALPAYMQFPTIREMHQHKAIGTTKEATVDDKGMWIGAKIVNKEAWNLVKEGVYKAFSIGGNVVKRVGNAIHALDLIEISLVDVPANKHAVIEVWKSGKTNKSAETVYSLTNLMIQVKDMIYFYEYAGKDSKKLSKILEVLKAMIAEAASEPEPDQAKMRKEFKQRFSDLILSIDFGENEVAKKLAKGVNEYMTSKDDLKKEDEVKDEEVKPEAVEPEETPEKTEEETPETSQEEKKDETPKETGEEAPTLQKLQEIQQNLETVQKAVSGNTEIHKETVNALSKMQETITGLAEKVQALDEVSKELQKAAKPLKSQAAYVHKSTEDDPATRKTEATTKAEKSAERIAEVKKQLKELETKHKELGPSEFAKQGHSITAGKLYAELSELVQISA